MVYKMKFFNLVNEKCKKELRLYYLGVFGSFLRVGIMCIVYYKVFVIEKSLMSIYLINVWMEG